MKELNVTTATMDEVIEFKNQLFGKGFSELTKDDLIEIYNNTYTDNDVNWHGDLTQFSRIQIRNKLVNRLEMTILEKEIETNTGINRELVKIRVIEALEKTESIVGKLSKHDYDYFLRFDVSWLMSEIRRMYAKHGSEKFNKMVKINSDWISSQQVSVVKGWGEDREQGVYYYRGESVDKDEYYNRVALEE